MLQRAGHRLSPDLLQGGGKTGRKQLSFPGAAALPIVRITRQLAFLNEKTQ